MTRRPRAVFDTNVFVSSSLSKNANSPTRELLQRWKNQEFTLLICNQIARELIEIVLERGVNPDHVNEQLITLARAAEWVEVPEEKIEAILSIQMIMWSWHVRCREKPTTW